MSRVSMPYAQYTIEKRTGVEFNGGVRNLASRYQYDKAKDKLNYLDQYYERINKIREARSPLEKTVEVVKAASPVAVAKAVVCKPLSAIAHGVLALAAYAFPGLVIKPSETLIMTTAEEEGEGKDCSAFERKVISDNFYKLDQSSEILLTDIGDDRSDLTESSSEVDSDFENDRIWDSRWMKDENEEEDLRLWREKKSAKEWAKLPFPSADYDSDASNTDYSEKSDIKSTHTKATHASSTDSESSDTEFEDEDEFEHTLSSMKPTLLRTDSEELDGYTTETDTAYNSEVEKKSLLNK